MKRKNWIIALGLLFLAGTGWAEVKKGALVLSFDDGYPSWIQIIAPELAKVGGKATGFVNNQRINNKFISFEDLRTLQNQYGWEIGTHTYHHFNAVEYVRQKGLETWAAEEMDRSVKELTAQGLQVRSLVFPFNVYNQALSEKVREKFTSFRRRGEQFPLAEGRGADGSMPGKGIDLAGYVPLDLLFQWIEYTHSQNKLLFLYGHDVLPDEHFFEGRVASVGSDSVFALEEIPFAEKEGVCLVPDKERKAQGNPLRVNKIEGKIIKASPTDLRRLTAPGATFILGPCYGTPLSYFQKAITFASSRLKFLT
ncbi:MAG: polysaccharide deacetylase family protein, partial [Thermodesulfobacteriota bacterium]